MEKSMAVGCYYFPNYHFSDARNALVHGPGWSEWEVVRHAVPRFSGHHQPLVPEWGYTDEADPEEMARKMAVASEHGIDYFIFDYYYYDDGSFLERGLDEGFLRAENPSGLRFALMWANHDWLDIHPCGRLPRNVLYPGRVSSETFRKMRKMLIERYFTHPMYFTIGGEPYFSIYHLQEFLNNFDGDLAMARRELDAFRAEARAAGLPGLHLNCVVWGKPLLPCEGVVKGTPEIVRHLGFDSVTSYVWVHHAKLEAPTTDYGKMEEAYFEHWENMLREYDVPYYPNATVGWDPSPRTLPSDVWTPGLRYPYTPVVTGNTPERFRAALERCARKARALGLATLNINSWNEWTEGSMLEPEEKYGMGYLEAVRAVFGKRA